MSQHSFRSYFFNSIDDSYYGGTIAVHVGYYSPVNIGEDLYFSSEYSFDYDRLGIPEGNSTITFEWTLHDGTIIGTTQNFTWQPPDSGYYYVEGKVTVTDNGDANNTFSIADVDSWFVQAVGQNIYSFETKYKQELTPYRYNNLDIHRFLSNFPVWSSAHKNYFSNSSKMISPILEGVSLSLDYFDSVVENNNTLDQIHFGYKEYDHYIYSSRIPKILRTEHGFGYYIGEDGQISLESVPISKFETKDSYPYSLKEYVYDGTSHPSNLVFDFENNIFIQSDEASIINPVLFVVYGLNKKGETVSEEIALLSRVATESLNKYLVIYSIMTEARSFKVSNHLDCVSELSYTLNIGLAKRISSPLSGDYFEPRFEVDGTSLRILNASKNSIAEEFTFHLENVPEKIFISNLLDVVYLYNDTLYSGKLMLDYYSIDSVNSTTNNNPFVFIDDENTPVGGSFITTVDIGKLSSELGSSNLSISLKNEDDTLYLQQDGTFSALQNDWIPTTNLRNKVTFSTLVQNTSPYIIELKIDNRPDEFIAINYQNVINEKVVLENTSKLFFYNKDLWTKLTTGECPHKILDPIRLGYTSSPGKLNFFNDFQSIEFV